MDIIAIEEKTYEQIKESFRKFSEVIREACQSENTEDEWLDGEEVCLLLQITKRTLQYYRDSGLIGFSQIRNKFYYKVSDIEDLIEKSTKNNSENGSSD